MTNSKKNIKSKKNCNPMKFISTTLLFYALLNKAAQITQDSKTLKSVEIPKNDTWFMDNLLSKNLKSIPLKYDYMTSKTFIEKHSTTASFSPICSDFNILIQCDNGEFGDECMEKSKKLLKGLNSKVTKMNRGIFSVANCFYLNEGVNKETVIKNGYLFQVYSKDKAEEVFSKHSEWVKKETRELLSTPLKKKTFEDEHRIYVSMVYFKDNWASPFNERLSRDDNFMCYDDKKVTRRFMNKKGYFKYENVVQYNKKFHIVAIPYEENNRRSPTRYMVYLIQKDTKTNLCKLWENFYSLSNNDIKKTVLNLEKKEMYLCIPKIEKLRSSFDTRELLSDIFKYNKAENISYKMLTYINVDEKGTEAAAKMGTICTDGISPPVPIVRANVPHISFIFDMVTERILFITKDLGVMAESK